MAQLRRELDVAQLVREHHEALYRYAYRLTGSVQDAEDLTQQAFLAAQKKIGQIRNLEKVRAWLFAILRNGFLRSRAQRRPLLAGDLCVPLELIPDRPVEHGQPDLVQNALNRMPEAQRVVLAMYYFENCSYREIAATLQMPMGTVMSRLSRAKAHLRSLLSGAEAENRAAGVSGP